MSTIIISCDIYVLIINTKTSYVIRISLSLLKATSFPPMPAPEPEKQTQKQDSSCLHVSNLV